MKKYPTHQCFRSPASRICTESRARTLRMAAPCDDDASPAFASLVALSFPAAVDTLRLGWGVGGRGMLTADDDHFAAAAIDSRHPPLQHHAIPAAAAAAAAAPTPAAAAGRVALTLPVEHMLWVPRGGSVTADGWLPAGSGDGPGESLPWVGLASFGRSRAPIVSSVRCPTRDAASIRPALRAGRAAGRDAARRAARRVGGVLPRAAAAARGAHAPGWGGAG